VQQASVNGLPVGQQPTKPAMVDVGHANTVSCELDCVLGLLLGAHEHDRAATTGNVADKVRCVGEQFLCLHEVDDVDAGALAPDKAAHFRIPATGLMAEVDACFEQGLH